MLKEKSIAHIIMRNQRPMAVVIDDDEGAMSVMSQMVIDDFNDTASHEHVTFNRYCMFITWQAVEVPVIVPEAENLDYAKDCDDDTHF